MIALALAVLLQAAAPPQVDASVDRDRVDVGDMLTLHVRAISRSVEPMTVTLPASDGFTLIGRSEHSEVSVLGPEETRVTTVDYQLRAVRPGHWPLGPALVEQNGERAATDPLVIDVSPSAATVALNPHVRQLIARAPPPAGPPHAALEVLLSDDSVVVGQQVDLVTLAWMPRAVRQQLRRPPLLQPPTMDGVWSDPQPSPLGVVATRQVGGATYDLFLAHQVVFPLVPGAHSTSAATLKYSVPVALQFFSQEERYTVTARPETLQVAPLPVEGRPAGFSGAVGTGIALNREVTPGAGRAGGTVRVDLTVAGNGNVSLWPSPSVDWPVGIRGYPERVEESVADTEGVLGGRKTFRFLLVPDSAGNYQLPAIRYPYYDLASHSYRVATLPTQALPVAASSEASASRAEPPPLLALGGPPLAWRIIHGLPAWLWLLMAAAPPCVWLLLRVRARPRRRPVAPSGAPASALETEFETRLAALVTDPERRAGIALVRSLRAAGIDAGTAREAAALREQLLASRYGPDLTPLTQAQRSELTRLIARLGKPRRTAAGGAALLSILLLAVAAQAQAPGPIDLYRSGAVRAAAEAFAAHVSATPADPAGWYDLGAAEYRLGREGRAQAHWLTAERLAPRNHTVRRALRLVPPPSEKTAAMTRTAPATPEELWLAGGILWLLGWGGLLVRRRRRVAGGVAGLGAAIALAGVLLAHWYARPLRIVAADATIQVSPGALSPAIAPIEAGQAVRPIRRLEGWVLVSSGRGPAGWLPAAALVPVGE